MGTILVTLAHLASAAITVAANNMPAKPSQGDAEILIDGTPHSLDGVKDIKIEDPDLPPLAPFLTPEEIADMMEEELLELSPWWTLQLQMVSGFEGMWQINSLEVGALPWEDWVELHDADGNKIWARGEDITSMTSNGPFWRGPR